MKPTHRARTDAPVLPCTQPRARLLARLLRIAFPGALAGIAGFAAAQDGAASSEAAVTLNPVVVTGSRVETGIRDAGMVEIVEGLAPGDLVVTKAAAFVRPGDRINPVPAEPVN